MSNYDSLKDADKLFDTFVETCKKNKILRKKHSEKKKDDLELKLEKIFQEEISQVDKSTRDISLMLTLYARLPMEYWAKGWVLQDIKDLLWRHFSSKSKDVFPATLRNDHKTHPAYVIREIGNYALEICPLSSKERKKFYYIAKGDKLKPTNYEFDRNSYLITTATSLVTRSNSYFEYLPYFLGIIDFSDLHK